VQQSQALLLRAKDAILASSLFHPDHIELESLSYFNGSLGDLVLDYAQAENVGQIVIGSRTQCPMTTLLDGSLSM
jgi:hypothetical protein